MLFAGTTRCTGCNTKYPSKLELVLWWVFIINCNVVTPLHCRPQPTVPNKAGLSKCLQEQSVKLVGNVPPDLRTDEALVWFPRSPKSEAKKPVRQAGAHKVTFTPWTPSSFLLALSEHLFPLHDHLVEFLQARLQTLTVQRRATLCVVQCGWAQLVQGQNLFHLRHKTDKWNQSTNHITPLSSYKPLVNEKLHEANISPLYWSCDPSCLQCLNPQSKCSICFVYNELHAHISAISWTQGSGRKTQLCRVGSSDAS